MLGQTFRLKLVCLAVVLFVVLQESAPAPDVGTPKTSQVLVVGAGLTGLFQVLHLFEYSKGESRKIPKVHLLEQRPRMFMRPQVIRLSPEVSKRLPKPVTEALWPAEQPSDLSIGENVQIANFQELLFKYLNDNYGRDAQNEITRGFFTFEFDKTFTFTGEEFKSFVKDYTAIIIATGDTQYHQKLRMSLGLDYWKGIQVNSTDRLGMYAIFKNLRTHTFFDQFDYQNLGLYYAPANDSDKNAQVYIYPGDTQDFNKFFEMDGSLEFLENETYGNSKSGNQNIQSSELIAFKMALKRDFVKMVNQMGIPIKDENDVQFYSASRQGYYHEQAATLVEGIPVYYTGDCLASTDYRKGENVGRAYFACEFIVRKMLENGSFGSVAVVELYNEYWRSILQRHRWAKNLLY